ncbi:MAG: ATP-binding cassette domain-containing protein, partial [Desulfatiglandales bacterium]
MTVENLAVSYDRIMALHGIDFEVQEREIVSIIGANGAGKSTTLRALSRLVPVHPGTKMTFEGQDLLKYPADHLVRRVFEQVLPFKSHFRPRMNRDQAGKGAQG